MAEATRRLNTNAASSVPSLSAHRCNSAMSAARAVAKHPYSVLKELCEQRKDLGGKLREPTWGESGPKHALVHEATLRVIVPPAQEARQFKGGGSCKADALHVAAVAALDELDPRWRERVAAAAARAEQDSLALVGDAALDLVLALMARERGLDAHLTDGLRKQLLNNRALGGGANGRALATAREADVGRAVVSRSQALTGLLHGALEDAGARALLDSLAEAVNREEAAQVAAAL